MATALVLAAVALAALAALGDAQVHNVGLQCVEKTEGTLFGKIQSYSKKIPAGVVKFTYPPRLGSCWPNRILGTRVTVCGSGNWYTSAPEISFTYEGVVVTREQPLEEATFTSDVYCSYPADSPPPPKHAAGVANLRHAPGLHQQRSPSVSDFFYAGCPNCGK